MNVSLMHEELYQQMNGGIKNREKKRVLIVEDEILTSMYIKEMLLSRGFEVVGLASSGDEAISIAREERPDIVLMDIIFEGEMDGIETAKKIMEIYNVPLIYITASTDDANLERAEETAPYGYIIKPINEYELVSLIRTALYKHEMECLIMESERKYRSLFENMTDAVILLKVQRDVNEAVSDALIIEANQSFEKITGVANTAVIDKCILDLYPYIKEFKPDWKNIFRQVIEDRKPMKLRVDLKRLGKWVKLTAYSPEPDHVAVIIDDITDIVMIEQELSRSEEMFRSISNTAQDGIIMIDEKGAVLYSNPSAEKIFGYSADEIVGKNIHQLLAHEHHELYTEAFSRWQKNGAGKAVGTVTEVPARRSNGTIITIELSLASMLIDKRWHAVGIARDITERKEAEKKLNDNLSFFRTLIETIPSPVFYKDLDGKYVGCNSSFSEKIIGHSEEYITGRTVFDLNIGIPPHLDETYHRRDMELMSNPGIQVYESEVLCADGKTRDYLFNKATYQDASGVVIGMIGVMVDITSQKENKEKLELAHSEINNILSSIDSILIGVSLEDRITHWNTIAEGVTGISRKVAVGTPFLKLDIQWEQNIIFEGIGQSLSEERTVMLPDISYINKDGEKRKLGIAINPIYDTGGSFTGFLLFGRDITERKILEMQLLQDQKLKSIGELASGIAHEINTPTQYVNDNTLFLKDVFTRITGLLKLVTASMERVREGDDPLPKIEAVTEKMKEIDVDYLVREVPLALEQSLEGLGRIAGIVKSMKSFSHPVQEEMQIMDINRAVNDTVNISRNEWKYYADIETDLDSRNPEITCNPPEINQVLLNIIVNAAHAVKERVENGDFEKGLISISTLMKKKYLEIRVSDNGPGIHENIRSKIFDPFFTTKEIGMGTGQGLAISYTIVVSKHKGKLYFETSPGEGTIFIIQIPVVQ